MSYLIIFSNRNVITNNYSYSLKIIIFINNNTFNMIVYDFVQKNLVKNCLNYL